MKPKRSLVRTHSLRLAIAAPHFIFGLLYSATFSRLTLMLFLFSRLLYIRGVSIFTALMIAAGLCSLANAETGAPSAPNRLSIAVGPFSTEEGELTSKLAYAKALLVWAIENGADQTAPLGPYIPPFEAELFAREKQIAIWRELTGKRPSEYVPMKQLLTVQDAGFLPEYIWHYYRRESWGKEASGLREQEFLEWKRTNLLSHRPQLGIGLVVQRQE